MGIEGPKGGNNAAAKHGLAGRAGRQWALSMARCSRLESRTILGVHIPVLQPPSPLLSPACHGSPADKPIDPMS
ncbi:hypothetical protein HYQ46_008539 [Verticillium longisporum]|nr:hypothetical protein HYQ46_008539 [Verticillium longisporum]